MGNTWYRDQRSGHGDIRECERDRLQELHPVPELQERGYPGLQERQTAGIAPRGRPCMTQGIPDPLSAWLSTVTERMEECRQAPGTSHL